MKWDHFGRKPVKSAADIPLSNENVKWDHFSRKRVKSAAKIPSSNESVKWDHFGRKLVKCASIYSLRPYRNLRSRPAENYFFD